MKRKKLIYNSISIVLLLVCLVCLFLLLVPMLFQNKNDREVVRTISEYTAKANEVPDEVAEKIIADCKDYNTKLLNSGTLFSEPDSTTYNSLLRVSDDIMGYINIPSVNIHLCIYHGTDEETIETGVGHLNSSSLPIGDETAHTVLIGHRGVPTNRLFTDLDKVSVGDEFTITVLNRTFTYKVSETRVVEPYQIEELKFEDGKNQVTLITCTPYGVNTHRIFVTGVLTKVDIATRSKSSLEVSQQQVTDIIHTDIPFEPAIFVFIGFVILFVVYFIFDTIKRKRGKHK